MEVIELFPFWFVDLIALFGGRKVCCSCTTHRRGERLSHPHENLTHSSLPNYTSSLDRVGVELQTRLDWHDLQSAGLLIAPVSVNLSSRSVSPVCVQKVHKKTEVLLHLLSNREIIKRRKSAPRSNHRPPDWSKTHVIIKHGSWSRWPEGFWFHPLYLWIDRLHLLHIHGHPSAVKYTSRINRYQLLGRYLAQTSGFMGFTDSWTHRPHIL